MKKIDFRKGWIALMALPLLTMSCEHDVLPGISGRGDVVTQTLSLDDFTGFGNAIAADIFVRLGDEQEVVMEAQQNIIDNLKPDRHDDGFWEIEFEHWVRHAEPIKIYITLTSLDKVVIAGSGDIKGEGAFPGLDNLELIIAGSGNMDFDLDSKNLRLVISGSGNFDLSGQSETLDIVVAGSGNIRAFDLETDRAEFQMAGSGGAKLSVANYLKATITGSGSVIYRGTPQTDIRITGSGEVKRDW